MKAPLVSILIPLYNAEQFVITTLESCINQTYKNIEIIVVDDGSTDNSYATTIEYSKHHPQVKVYKQPNLGACRARNLAYEKSQGAYIMYLDADDLITRNKVSAQVKIMNKLNDPYIVTTCAYEEFENTIPSNWTQRSHYHNYQNPVELLLDMWSTGAMLQTTCYLITRTMVEIVGNWDESLKKNQDGDYFSRVLMHSSSVYFADNCCVFYRRGHPSISTTEKNSKQKLESVLLSYKKQKSILNIIDNAKVRNALARNFSLILNQAEYASETYLEALQEIKNLGQKPQIINPSLPVRILSNLLGVEHFLYIKKYIKWIVR